MAASRRAVHRSRKSRSRKCPRGQIRRKAYTQHRDGKTIRVPSVCIKDRGLPGTFSQRHPGVKGIGRLHKGLLEKFGYDPDNIEVSRHSALDKAVRALGALHVFHALNAIAVYTRNDDPLRSAIYFEDRDYVKDEFMA